MKGIIKIFNHWLYLGVAGVATIFGGVVLIAWPESVPDYIVQLIGASWLFYGIGNIAGSALTIIENKQSKI